jgi:integrase
LQITGAIQRQEGKVSRSAPKTEAGARILPLPPELIAALEAQQRRQIEEKRVLGDEWQEHGLVFPSSVGTPMEPRNLNHHFTRVLEQAGLPTNTRLHDLRHACASFLIAQGVSPKIVQEILGHTKISTTMDIYAHVLPETHREALEKLGGLLKDEKPDGATRAPEPPNDDAANMPEALPERPEEPPNDAR